MPKNPKQIVISNNILLFQEQPNKNPLHSSAADETNEGKANHDPKQYWTNLYYENCHFFGSFSSGLTRQSRQPT